MNIEKNHLPLIEEPKRETSSKRLPGKKVLLSLLGAFFSFSILTAGTLALVDKDRNDNFGESTNETFLEARGEANAINNVFDSIASLDEASTYLSYIEDTSVMELLQSDSLEFTVFVPSNDAFDRLNGGEVTAEMILNHIVQGKMYSNELRDGSSIETLVKDSLKIRNAGGNIFINDAVIITRDIEVPNGIIHIVDGVLVPGEFGNVIDKLGELKGTSEFLKAIENVGLTEALSSEGSFTILAPVNAGLTVGSTDLTTLSSVQKHIIPTEIFENELRDGQEISTLSGEKLIIQNLGGEIVILSGGHKSVITFGDIVSSNGVIHIIDKPL